MNEYIKIALEADPVGMVAGFSAAEGGLAKFDQAVKNTMKTVKAMGQMIEATAQNIASLGKKMIGSGLSIGAGFTLAVKQAAEFQTQMKNVQSLTKASDLSMGEQTSAIMGMSMELPQAPVELASGLYDIASSGFEGADALEILNRSAEAASAGLTTTAVASKAIVAVMNAYGLSAKDVADISDTLFQGVNLGVMTFDALAGSMGSWIGMAASVGLAADEGTAAIATMTLAGIGADEASTYLSRLMETFIQPQAAMKSLATTLGYTSAKAMLDAKGLGGALLEINDAIDGNQTAFADLFPSIQAMRGAMAMLANDGQNWARVSGQIMDKNARSGATMKTYAIQAQSFAVAWKKFWNTIKVAAIGIGSIFLKPLASILNFVTSVIQMLNKFPEPLKKIVAVGLALSGVFLTLAGIFLAFSAHAILTKAALTGVGLALVKLGSMSMAVTGVSSALTGVGMSALNAGTWMNLFKGKLHSSVIGMRMAIGMMGGMGSALKMLGRGFLALALGPVGMITASLAAIAVLWNLNAGINRAKQSGLELAETFTKKLKVDTFIQLTTAISSIGNEMAKVKTQLKDMGSSVEGGLTPMQWLGVLNPLDGNALEQDIAEKRSQYRTLEEEQKKDIMKYEQLQGLAAAAYVQGKGRKIQINADSIMPISQNPSVLKNKVAAWNDARGAIMNGISQQTDKLVPPKKTGKWQDPLAAFFQTDNRTQIQKGFLEASKTIKEESGVLFESMMIDISDIAAAHSLTLDDLINPQTGQKNMKKIIGEWSGFAELSPSAREAALAFDEIGKSGQDALTNIEKLGNAITKTLDAAFGYEEANDTFEGMITGLNEMVTEFKKEGTLGVAIDFESFNKDSIALRETMRGLMKQSADDVQKWAASQVGGVSPDQLAAKLQEEVIKLRTYAEETGLPTEFVEHYASVLQGIVTQGTIQTAFANNAPEAKQTVDNYLLSILKTPESVTTFMKVYKENSVEDLKNYLRLVGVVDEDEINTIISVVAGSSYADLNTYVKALGVENIPRFIETAIGLSTKFAPDSKKVLDWLQTQNVSQAQYEQVVSMLGTPGTAEFQATTMLFLAELKKQPAPIIVDVDGSPAMAKINSIQVAINGLQGVDIPITVNAGKPPTTKTRKPQTNDTQGTKGGFDVIPDIPGWSDPGGVMTTFWGANGSLLSFFAKGGAPKDDSHVAQIAPAGAWRVWAEPETGGEAYIPMSLAKRDRSMAILEQVAAKFNARVVQFQTGGSWGAKLVKTAKGNPTDLASRSVTASSKKKDAEKAKTDAKAGTDANKEALAKQLARGEFDLEQRDASAGEKAAFYKKELRKYAAYSDEWMSIQGKIKDANKQQLDDEAAHDDAIWNLGRVSMSKRIEQLKKKGQGEKLFGTEWLNTLKDIVDQEDQLAEAQEKYGAISTDQYLGYLNTRLAGTEAFSTDWMSLTDKIKETSDKQQETFYKFGAISSDQYLGYLNNRLAGTRAYSTEWVDLTEKITTIEKESMSSKNSSGFVSDDSYLKYLKGKITATRQMSAEWFDLYDKIAEMEKQGLTRIADLYGKFTDRTKVSSGTILRYLQKEVTKAQTWRTELNALAATGQYDKQTLTALEGMGPGGVGLVRGLAGGAGTSMGVSIADLLRQATALGINTATFDRGGSLMPGITLAYNGTGTAERVGRPTSEGPAMVIESAVFQDATDVQMLGSKVGFAVRSARM